MAETWVERAAASLPFHEAEFWQRFLAAELSFDKSRTLIDEFGSLSVDCVERLLSHPLLTETERARAKKASITALRRAFESGISLCRPTDFSETLLETPFAPVAYFVDGDSSVLIRPAIAIVGTRSASAYGKACAMKFAEVFARAGVTVVSGGAVGIDAFAHQATLDAGGITAAVLAGGVDTRYPAVNHGLFLRIRERGCLLSQFALGTAPQRHEFLVRNELIAGLSRAVLVVEAPEKSGALHTAVAAAELGREVFVVPSGIDHLNFRGSLGLIRDGATLVYHPDQVLESLGIERHDPSATPATHDGRDISSPGMRILEVLSSDPVSSEKISELTGMETFEILSELTMLELEGQILRTPGGFSKRI